MSWCSWLIIAPRSISLSNAIVTRLVSLSFDIFSPNMVDSTNIYGFDPSVGAAVVAALLFGSSSLLHCYQTWKYRAPFFLVFIVGAISISPSPLQHAPVFK